MINTPLHKNTIELVNKHFYYPVNQLGHSNLRNLETFLVRYEPNF